MRLSNLFTRTTRENPADEVSVNAQLLERAGFVYKNNAGIYSYLPLGWRVIEKIKKIIKEEMDAVGGTEVLMPALIDKKYYEAAGRADIKVGFKTGDDQFILGWSHEEILTSMVGRYLSSYKDLPSSIYQIQTKFRNEARAKSGLLRGREFMMKDMYSFHANEHDFLEYYEKVGRAYQNVFERCGLKAYYTLAAGGDFTASNTHEFQVLTKSGEDLILLCPKCSWAINKEIANMTICPKCGEELIEEKSIEAGNIFPLGTKYSKALGLQFTDEKGEKQHVIMGCYGIGISRLLGTIVEVHHDDRGMMWPDTVSPFKVHLVALPGGDDEAEKIYSEGMLYDDRQDKTAGEKFADADLIGCPIRVVVSKKTLEQNSVEVKQRAEKEFTLIPLTQIHEMLK
ncbi:MAG: aminoacyl--tRNA ligase-related protein [Patescibacteria group bacterium]